MVHNVSRAQNITKDRARDNTQIKSNQIMTATLWIDNIIHYLQSHQQIFPAGGVPEHGRQQTVSGNGSRQEKPIPAEFLPDAGG